MLRSCSYCGRMHERTFQCSKKPQRNRIKERTNADKLRNTRAWKNRSIEIRQRDKGLCQICIRNLFNTTNIYSFDVGVHHIKPLEEGGSLLSGRNLITLCRMHHEMCERGEIARPMQQDIAAEQERNNKLF
jgi:5-methylcytosine-specific restriction protein A